MYFRKISVLTLFILGIGILTVSAYGISSPEFYLNYGDNWVNITDTGIVEGWITCVMEAKDYPVDAHFMVALYRDNKLLKVVIANKNSDNGKYTAEINVNENANGCCLKTFIWDSMNTICPLSENYVLKKTKVYYVSPTGSDSNSGTFESPWKTVYKAAQTAEMNSTVIFEDGVYNEARVTIFKNSGTPDNPITFKARNKHGAKIVYAESMRQTHKFRVEQEYINVKGFEFTQVSSATDYDESKTSDILLVCKGRNCTIIGNKFYNAYEDGIKITAAENILVEDNTVIRTAHEGIDVFNTSSSVIRNNEVIDCGRVGIMVKGNSRNCLVYNNYVHNSEIVMKGGSYGFTVGGSSNSISPYDTGENTGYEAYNCVFYNNIVYSSIPGLIDTGFGFIGAKECHAYNNIVVGTRKGFSFASSPGLINDWGWNVPNLNPILKNNIISDCAIVYYFVQNPTGTFDSDYNLFYNIENAETIPLEPHSKYEGPVFKNQGVDWSLKEGSPGIGTGMPIPAYVDGFEGFAEIEGFQEGRKVYIDRIDFVGTDRKAPWDMGVYSYGE